MTLDTAKITGRRLLKLTTLDAVKRDVDALPLGKVRSLGNWSPGQVYQHIANAMNATIDGFQFTVPWYFRLMGRLFFKNHFIKKGFSPGFQLSPEAAKQLVPPPTDEATGRTALLAAIERLRTESHRTPSPFLGDLTREESDTIQCRHAEHHLSFLIPESSGS